MKIVLIEVAQTGNIHCILCRTILTTWQFETRPSQPWNGLGNKESELKNEN
jgi:hypothetical protein